MSKSFTVLSLLAFAILFPVLAAGADPVETKFGFYADRATLSSQTLLINEALTIRITEVGQRLAKVSGRSDMNYTFRVINDSTINAYSAAGGFIYVNTGLLDVLTSEEELAAVMAHEMVHTGNSHQINFVRVAHRSAVAGEVSGILLGAVLGAAGGAVGQSVYGTSSVYSYNPFGDMMTRQLAQLGGQLGQAMGAAMTVSMIQGYGKEQELQADAEGVRYLARAGSDPNAMIRVLKKRLFRFLNGRPRDRVNLAGG